MDAIAVVPAMIEITERFISVIRADFTLSSFVIVHGTLIIHISFET
jgi:hypothetical protein